MVFFLFVSFFFFNASSGVIVNLEIMKLFQMGRKKSISQFLVRKKM